MKIMKCPGCAELNHFDSAPTVERCWNCGLLTDFSQRKSPEEQVMLFLDAKISQVFCPLLTIQRLQGWGTMAMVAALPVAVIMLLVCNSLHITIVHDPTVPFSRP